MSDHAEADELLQQLIDRSDLDGLVRLVDTRCTTRDWAGLRRLRDRARLHSGRQLWPASSLAEYRLALLAPSEWAAGVLGEDGGHFTIGPLTEVVAQDHTFESLRSHLDGGPRAAFVAHERVLRGEDVDPGGLPDVLDLPYALAPWEPEYALAEYRDDGATFAAPAMPVPSESLSGLPAGAARLDDEAEIALAVRQLVEAWTAASTGRAEVAAVEGDAPSALGALGLRTARVAPVEASRALAMLAWAGASGGANGRRRGAALGRFGAWWTLAALGGLVDDWPVHPDDLGETAAALRWWWWDDGAPATGWDLRLVVEDPDESVAVAIVAHDAP